MSLSIAAPNSVVLAYREIGGTHVFSSVAIEGLVHAGSHDKQALYDTLPELVTQHVRHAYDAEVSYDLDEDFSSFEAGLVSGDLSKAFAVLTLR